ncbi:hypothetical protein BLA29_005441, partial [Euroglyphus maynei]
MFEKENIVKVLKLGDATYRQWFDTLIDVLEALDLDEFIKDFKFERSPTDPPITTKEKNRIAKTRNIIKQSISKEDLEGLMDCKNPKEMIAELERKYRGPGAKSAWELLKDLDSIKYDGSIQRLFSRLRQLYAAFNDKGIKMPHHIINSKVRSVLPQEYSDVCKMLDMYNGGRKESEYMSDKHAVVKSSKIDQRRFVSPSPSLSLVSTSSIKFLADCGASFHIVNNRSMLMNIRKTNGSIRTLSGEIQNPEQGEMNCQLFTGERWIPMVIKDVFFVADQPFNLIAIGKICSNDGIHEMTNKDGMTIYHNQNPILVGKWSNDYANIIELLIKVDETTLTNVVNVAVDSLACWHERFGHFSTRTIAKMIRQKRVDGI